MPSFNRVILMGNLTKDPQVRYLPSGQAVCDFRLAMNRKYKAPDGQLRDESCFVSVSAWGKEAELCGQYLRKGSPALVEGRLKLDEWEKDGQKQSRLVVTAQSVQFLGSPRGTEFRDGPARPAEAGAAEGPPPASQTEKQAGAEEAAAADEDNLPF